MGTKLRSTGKNVSPFSWRYGLESADQGPSLDRNITKWANMQHVLRDPAMTEKTQAWFSRNTIYHLGIYAGMNPDNHHHQHHHPHRHHGHWLGVDRDQESCACDQLYWWQSCWGGTVNRYRPLPSPPFKFALRKLLIIQIMFFQILLWSQDKRLHEVNNLEASMCQ